jgi:antitoxin YefM
MDAISSSIARANLASTMDRVCEDQEPHIITRNGQRSVVMLSLDDCKAPEETAYLLRSPTSARRLLSAMRQLVAGEGEARELPREAGLRRRSLGGLPLLAEARPADP